MKRKRKIILTLCIALVLFLMIPAGGALYLYTHPQDIKPLVEKSVSTATGATCRIEKLSYALKPLSVSAEGIVLEPGDAHRGFLLEKVIEMFLAGSFLVNLFL